MIRYYVYFDPYGHPRRALSESELAARFGGDPEAFRRHAAPAPADAQPGFAVGHVGVFAFESDAELERFLDSLGEEIVGFFTGEGESRPYNF